MITSKTFSIAGIGAINTIAYRPDGATGLLPTFMFITGLGESGADPSKIYIHGPMHFIQAGWKPAFNVIGIQSNNIYGPLTLNGVQGVLNALADPAYGIDWTKYYLTGLSYGAAALLGYIFQQSDVLFKRPAAVIPMSINMNPQSGSRYDAVYTLSGTDLRFKDIPSWAFCGTQDSFFTTMNKYWIALKKLGYIAQWTTAVEGHGPWDQWYDPAFKDAVVGSNIYDWALHYTAGVVVPPVVIPPVVVPTHLSLNLKDGKTFTEYTDGTYLLK